MNISVSITVTPDSELPSYNSTGFASHRPVGESDWLGVDVGSFDGDDDGALLGLLEGD